MSKFKLTLITILITSFFISCEEKKKDNTAATAGAFLLTRSTPAGCPGSLHTALQNATCLIHAPASM